MTHDDAFLASIIESPEDDVPRLIYADWLEEQGQPERAEFIRVQCQLARVGEDDPRRVGLDESKRALLKQHQGEWAGPLPAPGKCIFRRGFIAELDLTLTDLGDAGAEALARSGHLATLEVLKVGGCRIREGGAQALLTSAGLPSLTTLHLTGNSLSDADVQPLFAGWRLFRLRELSLQGTFVDILELVRYSPLAQLTRLDLSENDLHFEDDDARALAGCEYLAGLISLDLGHDNMGPEAAEALASSPNLGNLIALNLWHNYIEPAGVRALLSSPRLGKLSSLNVSGNWIADAGAEAIASCAGAAKLSQLDLSYNRIGYAGARALATSPYLVRLTDLDLSNNDIGEAAKRGIRERFGDRVRF
jgi:uncharacterized protein (TIGR02996 family)